MAGLTTNVTLLVNRTKTYCDYTIYLDKLTGGNTPGNYQGRWEEIKGKVAPLRSGFSKSNPITLEGDAYMQISGLGANIFFFLPGYLKETGNPNNCGLARMDLEVWQHAFPTGKEAMAKKAEFIPQMELIIALFWT
jgi:hypothetical protein